MKTLKKAFSLVEVLVTSTIMAMVLGGIIYTSILLTQNAREIKDTSDTLNEISNFTRAITNFASKSFDIYFLDISNDPIIFKDYIFPDPPAVDNNLNILYFDQVEDKSSYGRLVYDQSEHAIYWYRDPNDNTVKDLILKDVYRNDAQFDTDGSVTDEGVDPVFRLPHTQYLYDTDDRPYLIILTFRKRITEPTLKNPLPLTLQYNFHVKVNYPKTS